MHWAVDFHDEFVPVFRNLPEQVQDEVYAIGRLLEHFGPQPGRPRVDTLNGSLHAKKKEMRFRASDGGRSVAFAFDPARHAIPVGCRRQSAGAGKHCCLALIRKVDECFNRHVAR